MTSIFISYRREDTFFKADRLFDDLSQRFGQDNVFRDIDSIAPGEDFVERINRRWATPDWTPIHYDPKDDFARSVAALPENTGRANANAISARASTRNRSNGMSVILRRSAVRIGSCCRNISDGNSCGLSFSRWRR